MISRDLLNNLYYRLINRKPRTPKHKLALVLGGGGARSAYQAGVLLYLGEFFPELRFPLLTGVSAGAINVGHLANTRLEPGPAATQLAKFWSELTSESVYREESSLGLLWSFLRGAGNGENDDESGPSGIRSLLDHSPLRDLLKEKLALEEDELSGIQENLERGLLEAAAVVTTNYSTSQTVTWVQGRDIQLWERPNRVSRECRITLDHIMASASLPLMFPAVRIEDAWYGDGGIRLDAPLSPAIHLGASHIMVVSTRYNRSRAEADEPAVAGYPPAAQILSILMNAIFLDTLDQDALMTERLNTLIKQLPPQERLGLRPVRVLLLRPSIDLGKLAAQYEFRVPRPLRLFTRGLGTAETESPDYLSMLLFDPDYLERLIDIGYHDARFQHAQIESFLSDALPKGSEAARAVGTGTDSAKEEDRAVS